MKGHLFLSFLLLFFVSFTFGFTPADYFSEADGTDLRSTLLATQNSDGLFGNLGDTHYTVSTLKALKADVPQTSKICSAAKDALKKKRLETIWHAANILDQLKCDYKVDPTLTASLDNELKGESLTDLYHAVSTLSILKAKDKMVTATAIPEALSFIGELAGSDGLFKENAKVDPTPYHAGLAFHTLALIKNNFVITADDQEQADVILEAAAQIFSNAIVDENLYEFSDPDPLYHLRATSVIFTGLDALAGAFPDASLDVNEEYLAGVAGYFLKHKHVSNSHDAFHLLNGLKACAKNNFGMSPLVVSLPKKSILASAATKGEDAFIKIRVTDVFGRFASKTRVYIVKAFPTAQETTTVMQNQEALPVSSDNTLYSFNFLAIKPDQGFYTFELSVTPLDKNSGFFADDRVSRNVKVVVSIELTDVSVLVADSATEDEEAEFATPVSYPKRLGELLRANVFQHVVVGFRVRVAGKPVLVHQAFVIFTNQETNEQAIFVAHRQGRKYKLALGLDSNVQAFHARSGKYSIHLVVGDSFVQNPIYWELGTVQINFGKQSQNLTVSTGLEHYQPLPEIHHTFNPPAKRPKEIISLFFTAAVLVPLLVLFIGLGYVRANIRGFPFSGASFLWATGFQGCIGAILALFVIYWLKLNMIQALGYLALIGIPTVFLGQKALRHVAQTRIAETSKKE
jgi:oligosaccharyltransferase complex subunit delta (ribophorin II)